MAVVGNALMGFMAHSEAEQAFQPWWDVTEDFLVYGLIMLGLVAFPTTMFSSTPLDCTICKKSLKNCDFMYDGDDYKTGFNPVDPDKNVTDPKFSAWWVKKYCTMTEVKWFTLYFPYMLLILPLMMVAVEKGFVTIFKANMKLTTFYNLLVKEITSSEGVTSDEPDKMGVPRFAENRKDVLELSQKFLSKNNFYISYICRTVMEILLATGLLVFLTLVGLPTVLEETNLHCDVYGHSYECSGHPIKFYLFLLVIAMVFLVIYGVCALYALLWLWAPCGILNSLSHVMYKFQCKKKKELPGGLTKYYYKNTDLRLLLNLLAESHGPATSLRVLALFDSEFNKDLKVPDIIFPTLPPTKSKRVGSKNISVDDGGMFEQEEVEYYNLDVSFDHAPANEGILAEMKGDISVMYTVEIFPHTKETSIVAVTLPPRGQQPPSLNEDEIEMAKKDDKVGNVTLKELTPSKEYTICVNTVVDGKTLACKMETFKWGHKTKND